MAGLSGRQGHEPIQCTKLDVVYSVISNMVCSYVFWWYRDKARLGQELKVMKVKEDNEMQARHIMCRKLFE